MLLASSSPRRQELLNSAGIPFRVVQPTVAEHTRHDLTVRELTLANAVLKAMEVARRHPAEVVLAADTLVALDGQIIGKPAGRQDAVKILRRLSGRVHQVCSSVFVVHLAARLAACLSETTDVRFRRLTNGEIAEYLARVRPMDKAGAYAAQEDTGEVIAAVAGSFSNVVGLPMERTLPLLGAFGIVPGPLVK